jgi:glyoxylase-like metal-dependent hydrolase (beta-lactamase superfamily II)
MLNAMRQVLGGAPIDVLVNTHSDGDHWWGNQLVGARDIVATDAAVAVMAEQQLAEMTLFARVGDALRAATRVPMPGRAGVRAYGEYIGEVLGPFDWSGVVLTRPTRTFSRELELDVGGRQVRLVEVGPAHTPGDLVVHLPRERVVFAGDIAFIGVTPLMWAGPASGWIAALETILALEPDVVVPGHGPLCGPAELRTLIDYWRWLEDAAATRHERGMDPVTAARDIATGPEFALVPWAAWSQPERIAVSVHTIYRHRNGDGARALRSREVSGLFRQAAKLRADLRALGRV